MKNVGNSILNRLYDEFLLVFRILIASLEQLVRNTQKRKGLNGFVQDRREKNRGFQSLGYIIMCNYGLVLL